MKGKLLRKALDLHTAQIDVISHLLLKDPVTGDPLLISSPLVANRDGSYSFSVTNPSTGEKWKHTILTVEELHIHPGDLAEVE